MPWFVYIILCADQSLYTGVTTDVKKRFQVHLQGKGAKYTRSHLPEKIVYVEDFETRSEALKREVAIKKLTRKEKEVLLEQYLKPSINRPR